MRILTFGDNAWDDTNSIGNTFSNFFSDWKDSTFFNIFLRDAAPNNQVCKEYLRISDKMLVKYLFSPEKIGQEFVYEAPESVQTAAAGKERRLIRLIHRYRLGFAYDIQRFFWRLKGWQNDRLREFVQRANPDIVFAFAIPTLHGLLMLRYLREHTRAKIVLFIADNVYGPYLSGAKSKKSPEARRFQEMMAMADKLYGASEEMCRVYGQEFGMEVSPLYKGCDFGSCAGEEISLSSGVNCEGENASLLSAGVNRKAVERPVRIVYAGNLLFGRLDTLSKLTKAIEAVNAGEQKFSLEIYSGTAVSEEEERLLSVHGRTCYCGQRQYEEIKQILKEADLVLHVESFEQAQIETVKYSFSTKIIDCLQSGSVMMVIGPKGISSVEYPRSIPGTVVIDDVLHLEKALADLYASARELPVWAERTRAYALEYHSIEALHERLQKEFAELL